MACVGRSRLYNRPVASGAGEEWYADGLRFECTMCGACCTGAPGYVAFTDAEAGRIARRLAISKAAFYREYAHRSRSGLWSLNERDSEHGKDCVFLDRETIPGKAVCGLYDDRPAQCRTFPFWPENLKDPRAWQRTARACEGVGRGRVVPIAEIRVLRDMKVK